MFEYIITRWCCQFQEKKLTNHPFAGVDRRIVLTERGRGRILKFMKIFVFFILFTTAIFSAGCSSVVRSERGEPLRREYRNSREISKRRELAVIVHPTVANPRLTAAFQIKRRLESEYAPVYRPVEYVIPFRGDRELLEFAMYTLPLPLHLVYFLLHWDFDHAGDVAVGVNPFKNNATGRRPVLKELPETTGDWNITVHETIEHFDPEILSVTLNGRPVERGGAIRCEKHLVKVNLQELLTLFSGVNCELGFAVREEGGGTWTFTLKLDEKLVGALREISVLEADLEKKPDDPRAAMLMAYVYKKYDHPTGMRRYLEQAFENGREDLTQKEVESIAEEFFATLSFDKAEEVYMFLYESRGGTEHEYVYRAALSAEKRRDYKRALELYNEALGKAPFHAPTNAGIGRLLYFEGRTREAYEYVHRAAVIDPANREIAAQRELVLARLKRHAGSKVDEGNAEALAEWKDGLSYLRDGLYEMAVSSLQASKNEKGFTAGAARPLIAFALCKIAESNFAAGEFEKARRNYESARYFEPETPHLFRNSAAVLAAMARVEKNPVPRLEKAVFLDPSSVEGLANLCLELLERGRMNEFDLYYARLERVARTEPAKRFVEAKMLASVGKFLEAEAVLAHLKSGKALDKDVLAALEAWIASRRLASLDDEEKERAAALEARLTKVKPLAAAEVYFRASLESLDAPELPSGETDADSKKRD